jgi:DNA-binding transcriptional regulator LsrR (DeoR family)
MITNNYDRTELLAFVARKYYLENCTQSMIANMVGLTRSSISRMLTEARQKGVVEIVVHDPFPYDKKQEQELQKRLRLKYVSVVDLIVYPGYDDLRKQIGKAASRLLVQIIKPGFKIGVSWGTTVQAMVDALEPYPKFKTQVTQLTGILGATRNSYSAQILVEHLAKKMGGEGIYLYAPFFVESEQTASSLLKNPDVKQAVSAGKNCDVAIVGVGSVSLDRNSLFNGNHIDKSILDSIKQTGAIGDVCGVFYDENGIPVDIDLHKRRIGVSLSDLKSINTRLGIAGSKEKVEAIIGAINGGIINSLVTDNFTAKQILEAI